MAISNIPDGYKQTEVGVIPEDWEVITLEKLCMKNGLVRGPFGSMLKKEFFIGSGIKVYEQRNAIYRNTEIGSYFIDNSIYNNLKRFEIFEGDFIVSCSGTIGNIFQIPVGAPKGIINQALLKITTNNDIISNKYFFYYFDWEAFQEKIIDNTQGGAMKNLVGMNVFRNTPIPIPPTREEQSAIATALSDTDTLISSMEQLIAKKRAIKQGAMEELLTGKRRLPGFNSGEGKYKQTEVGVIPEDWEVKLLKDISSLKGRIGWQGLKQTEFTMNADEPFLITGMNFKDGEIRWDEVYHISFKRYEIAKEIQLKTDDVLMTKDGTIGKLLFINKIPYPGKASLNSHLLVFRPIRKSYIPKFLYYQLASKAFKDYIDLSKSGSTFFGLSQEAVENYKAFLPSLPEQTAIAEILSDMDTEIETLEQKLEKYKKIKQGMMQELLTGRTRLI